MYAASLLDSRHLGFIKATALRSSPRTGLNGHLTDLALLCLRAVIVPIYTTQAVDQIRYILENSGSKMIFSSRAASCINMRPRQFAASRASSM